MRKQKGVRQGTGRSLARKAVILGSSVFVAAVLAFYALLFWIDTGAAAFAEEVRLEFPGDKVEALVAYLDSEGPSLRDKNHAIWALGRFRDPRALPALEKLVTGQPCDHAHYVCQYELKKAIENCSGQTLNPYFWR